MIDLSPLIWNWVYWICSRFQTYHCDFYAANSVRATMIDNLAHKLGLGSCSFVDSDLFVQIRLEQVIQNPELFLLRENQFIQPPYS